MTSGDRASFISASAKREQVVAFARRLISVPSPNPPGDTRAVAQMAAAIIGEAVPGAEVALHAASDRTVNLVARVRGIGPGRRLVLNGHLDTYQVDSGCRWSVDPFGGVVQGDRLYGRGAADMKGGIAASITALATLAEHRDLWRGEVVLALAGDEESMGLLGTRWLLDREPCVKGDAAIIADAGSPQVLRFGEKGLIWMEINATGTTAHGAHVHLGVNAIDKIRKALDALAALRTLPVSTPDSVTRAIAEARPISEQLNGVGEADVLSHVTLNISRIGGGTAMNLIPSSAHANVDIRLPVGISTSEIEAALDPMLREIDGLSWRTIRRFEPNYTDPTSEIVRVTIAAAKEMLNVVPVVNMRVGASDSRFFRMEGIPTIVYGPTPFNMGGIDEYALVHELDMVARIQALASLEFLSHS